MTEMTNQTGHGRIVVGVDGSAASKEALLWAAQQAEVTGASLEVVMAWEMPFTSFGRAIQVPGELDYAVEAEERLHDTIHEVLGTCFDAQPWERPTRVKTVVMEGRTIPTLVEAAKGAEMLVVGSSGHGAFVGMLLGSVMEHCVGHARCPVVVVRERGLGHIDNPGAVFGRPFGRARDPRDPLRLLLITATGRIGKGKVQRETWPSLLFW